MRLLLIPPSHSLRAAFWSQAFILRGAVQLHAAAPNPTGLSDALAEMIKITLAHLNSLRQACGGPSPVPGVSSPCSATWFRASENLQRAPDQGHVHQRQSQAP